MNIRSPETRRYLYGVVVALIPLLVLFGLIAPEDVATWTNLAGALLGLGAAGLALPNTPSGGGKHRATQGTIGDGDVELRGGDGRVAEQDLHGA